MALLLVIAFVFQVSVPGYNLVYSRKDCSAFRLSRTLGLNFQVWTRKLQFRGAGGRGPEAGARECHDGTSRVSPACQRVRRRSGPSPAEAPSTQSQTDCRFGHCDPGRRLMPPDANVSVRVKSHSVGENKRSAVQLETSNPSGPAGTGFSPQLV